MLHQDNSTTNNKLSTVQYMPWCKLTHCACMKNWKINLSNLSIMQVHIHNHRKCKIDVDNWFFNILVPALYTQMHTRSTYTITFRHLKLNAYISPASTPGPTQKSGKGPGHTRKIPRMCWVSIMCKSHVLCTKGVAEYGNRSCQLGATKRETRVVA